MKTNYVYPNGVGTMSLKVFFYIIVITIAFIVFQILYQKQLGAVSFFLISFLSFYYAYREWKRSNDLTQPDEKQCKD